MTNLTKDLIKRTFRSLLEEKPLSQITVKMIVQECGINRNSFYYHYQDIPALIEEMVQEDADQLIAQYPTIGSVEMALYAVNEFLTENKKAILHIYNSVNRNIFERYLWKICDYVVDSYGEQVVQDRKIDDFDKEILGRFFKSECFGIMISWLDQMMETDVQRMIARFCEVYTGLVEEMIERVTKK